MLQRQRYARMMMVATLAFASATCTGDLVGPDTADGPSGIRLLASGTGNEEPMTFAIPTPHNNLDVLGWTGTGIELAPGQAARIVVVGYLHFEPNPIRVKDFGPPPAIPDPIGPAGMNLPYRDGARVHVRLHRPDGLLPELQMSPVWVPAAESTMGYAQGPASLEVARPVSVANGAACYSTTFGCPNGQNFEFQADYLASGNQVLQVVPLDSAYIVPSQLRVQPGDTVQFEAKLDWTEEWGIPPTEGWWWVPQPASSAAPDSSPGPPITVTATAGAAMPNMQPRSPGCGLARTCRFVVTERGRMEVGVGGPSGMHWRPYGPVVEVGPLPPDDSLPGDSTPPPDTTLVLEVELARDSVEPVLARGFDAVRQTWSGGSRTDTVTVRVRVALSPFARSAEGAQVVLRTVPVPQSGEHRHDAVARPAGALFPLGANPDVQGLGEDRDSILELRVGATPDLTALHRSSGIGGREMIIAVATLGARTASDTAWIDVRVSGLVQLQEAGAIDTVGVVAPHPDSHWGTRSMVARLTEVADSLWATYGVRLRVNDMSLPRGGVFDLGGDWAPDHQEHRTGTSADIQTDRGTPAFTPAQLDFIEQQWLRLNPDVPERFAIRNERNGPQPHWHFRVRGER